MYELAKLKQWDKIKDLIHKKLVTQEMLEFCPKFDDVSNQPNSSWHSQINKFDPFADESNIFWLMISDAQLDLIKSVADKINSQTLMETPFVSQNNDLLSILLEENRVGTIKKLLDSPLQPLKDVPLKNQQRLPDFMSFLLEKGHNEIYNKLAALGAEEPMNV